MRKVISLVLAAALILACPLSVRGEAAETIPHWTADSPAMASIVAFVAAVTDEESGSYVPPEERIAVFDMDGTLYGELFPTYFDEWMVIQRLLYDTDFEPAPDDRAWAQAAETALLSGEAEPDSPRSGAQMTAESFQGWTVEAYRAYVREVMSRPAVGFEGMTYGEGFYQPMVALVEYLAERGFTVFICSGSERSLVRELVADTLGEWIPPYRVIGSVFTLTATGQNGQEGRKYTYAPEDEVLLEGSLASKTLKMNKVVAIVDEIGMAPLLVFGNSDGDLSMAQYALQHGGRAYMLLCDDIQRDYGNLARAASFAETCRALGVETVSMRDEFETIYAEGVVRTGLGAGAAETADGGQT